jgi:hypothetical protein
MLAGPGRWLLTRPNGRPKGRPKEKDYCIDKISVQEKYIPDHAFKIFTARPGAGII